MDHVVLWALRTHSFPQRSSLAGSNLAPLLTTELIGQKYMVDVSEGVLGVLEFIGP